MARRDDLHDDLARRDASRLVVPRSMRSAQLKRLAVNSSSGSSGPPLRLAARPRVARNERQMTRGGGVHRA